MSDWVVREAVAALQRWCSQGYLHLRMAVNLSAKQFWQIQLVPNIVEVLNSLNVPPAALTVELTETALMSDVGRIERVLRQFQAAGIEVAIDDFGTGYSSLARLKSLPIKTLNIDKSFLHGTPEDEGAVMLLRTITQMAKSLGVEALAEGVEAEAQ